MSIEKQPDRGACGAGGSEGGGEGRRGWSEAGREKCCDGLQSTSLRLNPVVNSQAKLQSSYRFTFKWFSPPVALYTHTPGVEGRS